VDVHATPLPRGWGQIRAVGASFDGGQALRRTVQARQRAGVSELIDSHEACVMVLLRNGDQMSDVLDAEIARQPPVIHHREATKTILGELLKCRPK
jgi:hypothetical protein